MMTKYLSNLENNHIFKFLKELVLYCIQKDVSNHAKALSFSTILSIVPLISIFFGTFASSGWMILAKDKLQTLLITNLVPKQVQIVFVDYLNIMVNNASQIKTIGLILFFFSILFLFLDIQDSFSDLSNNRIEQKWYVKFLSIFSLFIVPVIFFIFIALAEWVFSITPAFLQNIIEYLIQYSFLLKIFILFLLWVWFSFLYIVIPNRKIHFRFSLIGSALTTIFFILSQQVFSLYLSNFSSYTLIYGIFSIIPIFILWIYINWQIVLYGLAITFFYEKYYYSESKLKK